MSFQNSYKKLPDIFFHTQNPEIFPDAQKYLYNNTLAKELGIEDTLSEDVLFNILKSGEIPPSISPLAQAYAGHQFGHFTMLGDGRALLLTEWRDESGKLFDIALKGSGRTKYSRGGDGRATLKAMTREYIISECMHGLGVATSRSLAVIRTGEDIFRQEIEMGAILTRIMPSHLRGGTFEYARVFASENDFKALFDYTLERHFPESKKALHPAKDLLQQVIEKQTSLVAEWIRIGFIHGVMNTDNMSICGYTFDYGPCAFINSYHPEQVFSSIDTGGRYSFQNQKALIVWNLSILIQCFDAFLSKQEIQEIILLAHEMMEKKYYTMMTLKLGFQVFSDSTKQIIDTLLDLMQKVQADYTNTFVYLSGYEDVPNSELFETKEWSDWKNIWHQEIAKQDGGIEKAQASMRLVNPFLIPRNHIVEELIKKSQSGDMSELNSFLELFKNPHKYSQIDNRYRTFPTGHDTIYQTFCGT